MMAGDEQQDENHAGITFEGATLCGPARFEDGMTCVFDGQRWVCA